jgi:hypothetical protein
MPRFYEYEEVEVHVDIDVDDFLDRCDSSEKEELIKALIEDGYLKKDCRETFQDYGYSVGEALYQEALKKLHGKWNMLTKEEEETILNIAKRF